MIHKEVKMKYEIQVLKKYIVEAVDVATTLETSKNSGEQLIRILEVKENE
jgi:hypothetical protein